MTTRGAAAARRASAGGGVPAALRCGCRLSAAGEGLCATRSPRSTRLPQSRLRPRPDASAPLLLLELAAWSAAARGAWPAVRLVRHAHRPASPQPRRAFRERHRVRGPVSRHLAWGRPGTHEALLLCAPPSPRRRLAAAHAARRRRSFDPAGFRPWPGSIRCSDGEPGGAGQGLAPGCGDARQPRRARARGGGRPRCSLAHQFAGATCRRCCAARAPR